MTRNDSIVKVYMNNDGGPYHTPWPTFSAKYTIEREKLLKQLTIKHYMAEPFYTLKVKTFSFFRLWYTGLFFGSSSSPIKFKNVTLVSPFLAVSLLSFIIFLVAIISIPIAFIKNPKAMGQFAYPNILLLYFGFIHCMFAIQSRYTTPVKLILILLIAEALTVIFFPNSTEKKSPNSN